MMEASDSQMVFRWALVFMRNLKGSVGLWIMTDVISFKVLPTDISQKKVLETQL